MTPDITLWFSKYSRAFVARWLLEELGIPYQVETVDLRRDEQKSPAFLAINPMGKIPALRDGETIVSENPAIALLLADRYGYGTLAPGIEEVARGAYLRWMVFATAVLEPAIYNNEPQDRASASGRGWGRREDVIRTLDETLAAGPWLLGDQFSAADIVLGGLLSVALFNKRIADPPASLVAYDARLAARPAYARAAEASFGTS